MNWEQIKGGWKQMISRIKGKSSELTDEEIAIVAEKRDQLIGFLQESYGCEKKQAEAELDRYTRRLVAAPSDCGNLATNDRTGSEHHDAERGTVSQPPRDLQKWIYHGPVSVSCGSWRVRL